MSYIHECDFCGKRFPNGAVLNVVSFFKAAEEKSETPSAWAHVVLNPADPRYELCDDCFELARNTIEGMRATADVLRKADTYKEILDFERGENEH